MIKVPKPENRKQQQPIDAGLQVATCYAVFDTGTTMDEKWGKLKRGVTLVFEVPEFRIEIEKDGKKIDLPRAISKSYSLSLHEKATLRKHIESWRGKKFSDDELGVFDLETLAGKACMLNITHTTAQNGNTYANIDSIMPLMKGIPVPKQENDTCTFSFDTDEDFPQGMPEWIRERAMESDEWKAMTEQGEPEGEQENEPEDDLPF